MQRRLAAILAADVVGFSRLMGKDETGTLAQLKKLRAELIDKKIAEHHGRIFKLTGDGILAEFPSVVNAVTCAAEWQRAMKSSPDERIRFRIGINLGDVIVDADDIYGDGVNVASRLEGIAQAGGIAISHAVREQIGNRLDLSFEDSGEQQLKNIERPIRVYAVVLDHPEKDERKTTMREARPSIAVLPFTNMSGDPEQEYFSDGITEDIITDLSKVSGLFVVARHTAFTYKGKSVKVQQLGKELGVGFLLEGSVRKAGARIRVTAQLINARDGGHIWAERFDRDLTDIFAIQDEITRAIVEQLKIKLLPRENAAIGLAPTSNVEAYNYYLRGREYLYRHSRRYYELARRMFSKALELDPNYGRAYAGIAICDGFLFITYQVDLSIEEILATSARALALENDLAIAHTARGVALFINHQLEEANREFEKGIALDPNSFEAHFLYARPAFMQGNITRAVELLERAAAISPDSYKPWGLIIHMYRSLGREADCKNAARKTLQLAEQEILVNPEDPRPVVAGALALLELGEIERAKEWARRGQALESEDDVARYNLACVYTHLGEIDLAFDLLRRVVSHGRPMWKDWIEKDSDLDGLRQDPRFQQLLAQIR